MRYLITVLFALCVAVSAPPLGLVALVLQLLVSPWDPDRRFAHAYGSRYSWMLLKLNPFWRIQVEGRALIPAGPCVLVANHQSMADVAVSMGLLRQFKFVSKVSLFSVPVIGWMMTLSRYVRLDRGKLHSTQQMMEDCRHWLRRGMPVLIYPEGTYSPEEGRMLPFKRGAFKLAIEEQVLVVPVVIEGTRSLIVGDGPWMSPRCRIRVRVLPPLPPGSDEDALTAATRAALADALGYPVQETPGQV